jgi:hypothetical protein
LPPVQGYVGTFEIDASMPSLEAGSSAPPEAQALLGRLKDKSQLKTRLYLSGALSHQEVVSTDFVLPEGTVILHEGGAKYYVLADPKEKTYVIMDAEGLMNALEGGLGIVDAEYQASVEHTSQKKQVGDFSCRKSVVTVKYVSAIPLENEKVYVQQANDIEVWHTFDLVGASMLDQFFFKFERDKTRTVQKLAATELGFPLEMTMVIAGPAAGRKTSSTGGTVHMSVGELRVEKRLDPELFRIPPAGYKRLDRNPYFKNAPAIAP